MPTSYTSLLGFALPVTGELAGTWGTTVNNSITELVEDSIAATASASVTSGDWTLTTTGSGATNEARCAILIPTGTPGVSRNIVAPSQSKAYIVINQSDSIVVLKGSATTGTSIAAGAKVLCAWNGSDFITVGGLGDVVGPASSTDNAFVRWDSTSGKIIQNSVGATLDDSGSPTFTSVITVAGTSSGPAAIRLSEDTDNGTNYVGVAAPSAIVSNVTFTLPAADGVDGQVLTTNGAGTLSFTTPTPAVTKGQSIAFALIFG